MALFAGARLGPYEILAPIGAGGMGEVYRARDTRLERTVAIKVLPEAVEADPESRERFGREARAIAALNHPNICTTHDVGEERGTAYLVMELLAGETLATRLGRGALPVDEALRIARDVAGGLDAAHRAGIVHRDLKPGNIMLVVTPGRGGPSRLRDASAGQAGPPVAKLLDFGLAKLAAGGSQQAPGTPLPAALSMLPTTPPNLTVQGTILGTFQYMAPEQLEGQEADARSDIFAFGAVLYEMLTGRKAFEGKSQATLIAAIVGSDPPPVSTLQPVSPPLLDEVVRTCLAKDPDARWQSVRDLQHALALATKDRPVVAGPPSKAGATSARLAWAVAALCVVAAAAVGGWVSFGRTTAPPPRVSFDINTESAPSPLHLALSPDGTRLAAIISAAGGGPNTLWLRRLDQVAPRILEATAGASFPFWSPDGRFIGFFANGKLNKVDVNGGPVEPISDAPFGVGGTWSRDGTILFAPSQAGPLFRVSATGGRPVQVTTLDPVRRDVAHRHPRFLPDANHFVFFLVNDRPEDSGLYLGALDSKATRQLSPSDAMGAFVPPGHLTFMRDTTLMARRFDPGRLEFQGDPFPVAENVGINTNNSVAGFTFSENGVLATRVGGSATERVLRWVDRAGKALGDVGGVGPHDNVAFSPDGTRFAEIRPDGPYGDIWISDLSRGTSSRFTFDPALDDNPLWSPDGRRIAFGSSRSGGVRNLYVKSSGGAGTEELLLKTDSPKILTDWSHDGQYILYTDVRNGNDVWVLPLGGARTPFALLSTRYSENRARFSPDGHWIAYTSDESGGNQIYVQSFPPSPSGGKWQISTIGGAEPQWRGDGRELFYVTPAGSLYSVEVHAVDSTFNAGIPKKLFDTPNLAIVALGTRYHVTPDGQRFLLNLNSVAIASAVPPIRVVLNWMTGQ